MKINNKQNINETLYKVAVDSIHPIDYDNYSVTEILKSVREIILYRRHYDEIEVDVSDLVSAMFGSAMHKLFEENNKIGQAELELQYLNLKGVCDLYHDKIVEDYKTTSVAKVMKQDFTDHIKQCKIYAYMIMMTKNEKPEIIKINYLMKDWSKIQSQTRSGYPQSPIYVYEYKIQDSDYDDIWEFIKNKLNDLKKYGQFIDSELPECSLEERKGEDVKCKNYCSCSKFCNQFNKK